MRRRARALSAASTPAVADLEGEIRGARGFAAGISLLVLVAFLALAVTATPAIALTKGHAFSFSFGSTGSGDGQFSSTANFGQGVAVDESTGDIYVTDSGNYRILKFDSAGNFLEAWGYGVDDGSEESQVCTSGCQTGIYGSQPGQFGHPTDIAVDNSNGPNAGTVYVADTYSVSVFEIPGFNYVQKFDSEGNYLGRIDGGETPGGVFHTLPPQGPIAVDANGYLWALAQTTSPATRIMKFTNDEETEYVGGSEWVSPTSLYTFAVNAPGTGLVVVGSTKGQRAFLVASNGADPGEGLGCGGLYSGSMTFDFGTGNFFVGDGNKVCEYDEIETRIHDFTRSGMSVQGIAANGETGVVYVASLQKVHVFIPRTVPDVSTSSPAEIGHTTAKLTGEVAPDPAGGGDIVECKFQYVEEEFYELGLQLGLSLDVVYQALGGSVPCEQAPPITGPTEVSAEVAGLTTETTYRYRIVAKNSIDSNPGSDLRVTPRHVLGLTTEAGTDITPTSATLNGSFDPAGEETHYYFEWGTDTSYGNVTAAPPGEPAGPTPGTTPVSAEISGLTPYTTYHFRLVATNSQGTSYGYDETVRTAPPLPPVVSLTKVEQVADTEAQVGAMVNPNLGSTVYRIQYGTTPEYGSETPVSTPIGSDQADHPVSASLTELEPGTTYHFRVLATNFAGTTAGPDTTFTTTDAPTVAALDAIDVGTDSAKLRALVNPQLSATTYYFEYGPTPAYGSKTPSAVLPADGASHEISASVSGLTPGATYHFRAVAVNEVGTTQGPDQVLKTDAAPSPEAGGSGADCERFVRLARQSNQQAARLARRARSSKNAAKRRGLRKRSRRAARRAKQLKTKAKACSGATGGSDQ